MSLMCLKLSLMMKKLQRFLSGGERIQTGTNSFSNKVG